MKVLNSAESADKVNLKNFRLLEGIIKMETLYLKTAELRHLLHQNPELSGHEKKTVKIEPLAKV